MSQPWLEDLSEDWIAQPGDNDDSLPQISSVTHNSAEIKPASRSPERSPQRSRIPRLRSSPAPATRLNRASQNIGDIPASSPLPGKRRTILQERTSSDNNAQKAVPRRNSDDPRSPSQTRSASVSSTDSVVHHSSIEFRPLSFSPDRSQKPHDTPEWKRRLIYGKMGYGDQRDLFSPMGLENIFAQPSQPQSSPAMKRKSGLSMLNSSFNMPSSPPPLPSQLSQSSPARPSMYTMNSSVLNDIAEHDSEPDEDDDASAPGSEVRHSRGGNDGDQDASFQEQAVEETPAKYDYESRFGHPTDLNASSAQKSRVVSGQTELTDDSFGPVYITKHKTKDGSVEYAAVDLSKSELEKMRNMAADTEQSRVSNFNESQHSYGSLRSEPLPEDLPTGTPEHLPVGDFVNVKRGGFSADGSFRHRPLSPSPLGRTSSDIEDAAMIGSRGSHESNYALERPPSNLRNQFVPREMSPPISPSTPARRPNSSFLHPDVRPLSSSSPLKLFGDHDTFTANKLQRRMSQMEDTLFQEEHASENRRSSAGGPAKRSEGRLPSVEEVSFYRPGDAGNDNAADDEDEEARVRQSFRESNGSYFGRGDLDGYHFPEDSFRSSQNSFGSSQGSFQQQDDRAGSPPPDSMPKFQFSINDGTVQQTIHTKRKLSKHTIKSWTTTVTNKNSIKIPKSPRMGANSLVAAHDEIEHTDLSEGKRPPTSPFKNPSAKRRRTLHAVDMQGREDAVPYTIDEDRDRIPSGRRKKSQEGRPARLLHSADPHILARRNLLRPRNPTPNQRRREQIQADILEATEAYLHSSPKGLQAIQEHLESPDSRDRSSYADDERAVASQIAAFTIKLHQGMKDEDRKRSVTTQDFLDEARLIMDHIRARGRPNSALQSLAESGMDTPTQMDSDFFDLPDSPISFSRPPSREGSKGGWRNPGTSLQNPRVVSHLRKFAEEDGEDFMASSFRSFNVKQLEDRDDSELFQGQSPDIRILTNNLTSRHRERAQSDATQLGSRQLGHGDSHQSRPSSMGSSMERTNMTSFSRRSDNVATLAPEAVAHLIPREIAGMSFDREKGIWIRRRTGKEDSSSADLSNATTSEDDPLRHIPDLTVDEIKERRRMSNFPPSPEARKDDDDPFVDNSFATTEEDPDMYNEVEPTSEPPRPRTRDGAEIPPSDTNSAPSKFSSHFSSSSTQAETRATSLSDKHARYIPKHISHDETIPEIPSSQAMEDYEHEFKFFDDERTRRTSNGSRKRSDAGFSFASRRDSQVTDAHEEKNDNEEDYLEAESPASNALSRIDSYEERKDIPTPLTRDFVTPRAKFTGYRRATKHSVTDYSASPSPARDNELSIIRHPDSEQRRMRFKVSLSRPIGSPAVVPRSPANPYGFADVTFVLSELPDFTVNGDDEREMPNRTLVKRTGTSTFNMLEDRFAQGTVELVKALQDNEPDEPFWEDLRRVDLHSKDLPTLHRLDELCYRVEALDVSNNHIAQLTGAPSTLRRLNIMNNCLTNLTSWGHLTNLQYLDVSGNAIGSLKGFAMLIHLRELRADDNEIESLDGILEMDALLKLSLKGNKIGKADFEGSYLERLTELDLSDNEISSVRSLDALPSLKRLALDDNELQKFPTQSSSSRAPKVKHLSLSRNRLTSLDVSFFPSITHLTADSNNLSSLSGSAGLRHLRVLSARDQHPASASFDTASFLANPDVSELYLSSNTIPTFSFPLDTAPFLNLQRLDLASCGLHTLPEKFGQLAPNVRQLNLNFNALKDLRPLLNSKKLERIDLAGNRLARLRRNVMVLARIPTLKKVDVRNNAFNVGFYPPDGSFISQASQPVVTMEDAVNGDAENAEDDGGENAFPPADEKKDASYLSRLDADTKLRRRVYEMLVAHSCKKLVWLDGLPFSRDNVMRKDEVWERLLLLGVVRKKADGGSVLVDQEEENVKVKKAVEIKVKEVVHA